MNQSEQRQTVTIDGLEVAVLSKGEGTPIVLLHGNSLSKEVFAQQFTSSLPEKYQLIAFDFPGHGASSVAEPGSGVYSLPGFVEVLLKTVAALGVEEAVFLGHSLGGHVLLEAMDQLPKALGAMICGTPPLASNADVAKGFLPNPDVGLAFTKDLSDEQIKTLAATFVPVQNPYFDAVVGQIKQTHALFREEMAASIGQGKLKNEVQAVKNLQVPIAVVHGEADALVSLEYIQLVPFRHLFNGQVQVLKDCGHSPMLEQPDLFNQYLDQFASYCQRGSVLQA